MNHLIQETCKKSSDTDPNISLNFCISSLEADPSSHSMRLSLTKLGLISMNLTRNNVTETRVYIKHLLKKKKIDRYIIECLKDCLELYSDAITTVEEAIGDYRRKRYVDSNAKVSSVLDASSTCEDGFKENSRRVVSPLTKRNNHTFQLSAIALSITDMVRE
ncbi:putative invertase inhibitor [Neltuma alba]|uniref:putative invertase inhibitor n=1 Tax=Neltuma alba TaxID=207710 RepID=UPI0010A4BC15|nr:putative invertase inhibitor [Prosopis alba]XP_028796521.1 putative invertase inhibitor [Prosopis alba]